MGTRYSQDYFNPLPVFDFEVVPCDIISYDMIDFRTANDTWMARPSGAIPPELVPAYRHIGQHPLVAYQQQTGESRAVKISDFVTGRQFHRLELYNEFFRHLPVEYQMAVGITIGQDGVIGIGLSRSRRDFSESERLLLNLIRPHLVRAYQNAETFTLFRQAAGFGGRELILVSRANEAEFSTDRALRWLATYFDVSRLGPNQLPDTLQRWVEHWRACVRDGNLISSPPSTCLTIQRGDKSLVVHFIPGGKASNRDLLLMEERQTIAPAPSFVALGFTRREAEVVVLLTEGKTNVEIGQLLGISPRTVQTYLEKVFTKLAVHTRAAAVGRALQLIKGWPPVKSTALA